MKRLAPTLLALFALVILAGGAYLYFGTADGAQAPQRNDEIPVDVVKVDTQPFADRIQAVGTTRANESVFISARVSDTVESVNFDDGDIVQRGDVLVRLNMAEQRALMREAEATLLEAEQQLERTEDLVQRGNASKATLDERRSLVEEAKARVGAARARINDRIILAPFDGILGLREISEGALVSPGMRITTLDDITPIKLDFPVPERFLSALAPGQRVVAKAAAYPDREFTGEVKTISSRVDPVTRAVTVRAEIANEEALLRPGMLLTVDVINREREAIAVPEEALIPLGEEQFVYIINGENKADRRRVTIGARRPGQVEILSGIEVGELVVVAGTLRLRPGTSVRIMERGLGSVRPQA